MGNHKSAHKPTHSVFFIYGYALGEFGFTFFLFFISYYLMVFMTDVLKLPTALAAVLYTGVQWVEAVTMIFSGLYIDRPHRLNGKFRPWLIIGSVILLAGMVVFYTVFPVAVWLRAVIFVLGYLVAYWGYNLMWVSYRTMLGPLSRNPQDAISLNSASAQMGSAAGLCFSFICVRLLNSFSTPEAGYTMSALAYGLLIVLCMAVVSRMTKPFDNRKLYADGKASGHAHSLKETIRVFSAPMRVFFLAVIFREAASTILPSLLVYYFTYVMGNEGLMSTYLTVVSCSGLIAHFFARKLANIFGKKQMFIAGSLVACVCILSMQFTADAPAAFMVLVAIKAFAEIFSGSFIPAFMTEIADYNEYTIGVNARAFTSAVGGTALRFAQIIGGAIASFGLVVIGYSSGEAMTPGMISGISGLMIYGSTAVIVVSIIIMLFYKIDPDVMEKIYQQRIEALEKENAGS